MQVRGRGLLIGVEFDDPAPVGELLLQLLDAGVVVNSSLNNNGVLRFTPPAVLTSSDEDYLLSALTVAVRAAASRLGPVRRSLPPPTPDFTHQHDRIAPQQFVTGRIHP